MKSIHFSQLAELNDQTHVAFVGLSLDDTSERGINKLKALVNASLEETGVFKDGVAVSNILRVTGNRLGDEGRHDFVFELSNGTIANISPLQRMLRMPDLKWLDDFIVNYERDYFLEEQKERLNEAEKIVLLESVDGEIVERELNVGDIQSGQEAVFGVRFRGKFGTLETTDNFGEWFFTASDKATAQNFAAV